MAEIRNDKKNSSDEKLSGGKSPDEKSCGTVLFHGQKDRRKYLVLHYPGGHFDFPKGHVEKGEEGMEHKTALRELEEETGIKNAEILPNFRYKIYYTYNKKGKPSLKKVIFFIAKTKDKKITLSFEHKNFFWLDFKSALEKLTFANAKNLLQKVEEYLSKNGL